MLYRYGVDYICSGNQPVEEIWQVRQRVVVFTGGNKGTTGIDERPTHTKGGCLVGKILLWLSDVGLRSHSLAHYHNVGMRRPSLDRIGKNPLVLTASLPLVIRSFSARRAEKDTPIGKKR